MKICFLQLSLVIVLMNTLVMLGSATVNADIDPRGCISADAVP